MTTSETARIKSSFIIIMATITLVLLAWFVTGCTTAQLKEYQKSVDSRSVEGYAKDGQGGVKYTVHYK